jgi:hypothetical protein
MKQPLLAGSLLLLAICYLSWNTNHDSKEAMRAEKERKFEILQNVFSGGDPKNAKNHGHPIPVTEIDSCQAEYIRVMKQYGITTDMTPQPYKSRMKETYPITTCETFAGADFVNWLNNIVNQYDSVAKGANLDIHLKPGIYTEKFLRAHPDAPQGPKGRISIFAVVMLKDSLLGGNVKGNPPTGYELGGLEP